MHALPLCGISHRGYALPQGKVRSAQGLLDRLFVIDRQEGLLLHRARPQAGTGTEDLPEVQEEGNEGHEELGEPSHNRHGGGGRDRLRPAGGGRPRQEERGQEARGGRDREKGQRRKLALRKGIPPRRCRIPRGLHEGPHRYPRQGDHGPMVGIRAVGKGFQEHGTGSLGKERGQLPRTAQGDHDAQGLAKGNAPPCGASTGLS